MGIVRLLLLVAIVWLAYSIWCRVRDARQVRSRAPSRVERMVKCGSCGVHLAEKDAIREGDSFYCSEAHRLARSGDRE